MSLLRPSVLGTCLAAALALLLLAGCDEDSDDKKASAPDAAWIYTANYQGDTISAVQVEFEDGAMSEVAGSPYPADAGPWTVLANPAGDQLFLAAGDQDTVQSFLIDGDNGELDDADTVTAPVWPRSLAITPSGDFLYVGGFVGSVMNIFDVDASTATLAASGTAPNFLGQPVAAVVEPSGSYLYSVQSNVDSVNIYTVAANGSLTDDLSPLVVNDQPWAIAASSDGNHVYVANIGAGNVTAFSIIGGGDLSTINSYGTGTFPTGVAITPSGDYVYVSDTGGISIFSRNASTGALTGIGGMGAGTSPEALAIDATGIVLAVVDSQDDTLRVYQIDPDSGALAESPDSPFPVGEQPRSVAIVNAQ